MLLIDLIFFIKNKNNLIYKLSSINQSQNEFIVLQDDKLNIFKNNLLLYFNTLVGYDINEEFYVKPILNNINQDSIKLTQDKLPAFIFYFTSYTCGSCVNETIELLAQKRIKYPKCKIMILVSSEMDVDLNQIKRVVGDEIEVYIKNLKWYFKDKDKSYFFLLGKEEKYKMYKCFSPNINEPDITEAYLESIVSSF